MNDKKIWVPKEIKQPETIWFQSIFGIIKRPVTSRQILYFVPSAIISGLIFLIVYRFTSRQYLPPLIIFCLMLPFIATIIGNSPQNGKYLEDIVKTKLKYKAKSGVILNEKATRARRIK